MGAVADRKGRIKKLKLAVAIAEGEMRRPCPDCSEEDKRTYGCKEDTKNQLYWIRLDRNCEPIKRCPYALVKPYHYRLIQAASLIECGILPDKGAWLDQAATFADAACVIASAKAKAREKNAN